MSPDPNCLWGLYPFVYSIWIPDVVRMGRSQPNDRAVLVVETPAFLVSLRQLKAFFAPDPLNLLVVHLPAFDTQQFRYLAIAVAPISLRQPDQGEPESIIIFSGRLVLQGTTRQAYHPAGPPLRCRELLTCMDNGLTELPGRQALGYR